MNYWMMGFFSFSTLNILAHCLATSKTFDERSVANLIEDHFCVIIYFPLAAFKLCALPFFGFQEVERVSMGFFYLPDVPSPPCIC